MGVLNNVKTVVKTPYVFLEWLVRQPIIRNLVSDRAAISMMYRFRFNRNMNWDNPQTINEKLLWKTVYDRNPIYTVLADKYEAKRWISEKLARGGYSAECIIPTYNVYSRFEEIDFDQLPESFVLKATHDSGTVLVINAKSEFTVEEKRIWMKRFKKSLKRNYYWYSREWQYKGVKPRIIAEKRIYGVNDDLADYKIFCFEGKAMYWNYISNRKIEEYVDYVEMDGRRISCSQGDYKVSRGIITVPSCWKEMIDVAEYLSQGFPFLRVDFFVDVNERFYLGELTLTPSSGLLPFHPDEWDYKFGEMLKLTAIKSNIR